MKFIRQRRYESIGAIEVPCAKNNIDGMIPLNLNDEGCKSRNILLFVVGKVDK